MMESKNVNMIKKGDLVYLTFDKLNKTGITNHAFSTRFGGVSKGCFFSMNMSFTRGEEKETVAKNYALLCEAVGIKTENLVFTKQTHTDNVIVVTEKDRGTGFYKPSFEDIDGLVTNCKNVALVTQFADCTPLIFCDPVKKVIASSHSGWRGTVKKIGKKTVSVMTDVFGSDPKDIVAVIGPCIGKCCYEVDGPVFTAFKNAGFAPDLIFTPKQIGKYMLDLKTANRLVLKESGVLEENIEIADICTCCNKDAFYSHRAHKEKRGNLCAIIELK